MNGVEQALIFGVESGTAILLPGLGEMIGQRAGVINLGTEGCMLSGALASFVVASETGSIATGVVAGLVAGMLCGLLHGWLTVRRGADQLASGLVVWFLALGVTSVFGSGYTDRIVTGLDPIAIPGLSTIPWVGPILFDHDILVYVGYALVPLTWYVLWRTRIGLSVRAAGERPEVVATAGGRPQLIQMSAVAIGAGLSGVGGAQLSLSLGNWTNNMTAGYGFVAVAVVLFAAWRPLGVLAGSYLFGIALASASVLQAHGVGVNQYLLDAMPYLITLTALVLLARRGAQQAPEALVRALTHAA
ncbi:MAG: ral nucleoside transport system permease protein [Frankiales bacterium]|jgi:simple sugar transport system permease protein|nr:ral nucleoside transport system permease protein [Frankiales bacterium]MDX6246103.1 ral nucleoside transport system permease protein [Frankiales bacterium]